MAVARAAAFYKGLKPYLKPEYFRPQYLRDYQVEFAIPIYRQQVGNQLHGLDLPVKIKPFRLPETIAKLTSTYLKMVDKFFLPRHEYSAEYEAGYPSTANLSQF